MMAIKKGKNGGWIVSHVIEEHNHDLATPSKVHNFRSHRNIGDGHAEVIKNMHSTRVQTNLMMSFLAMSKNKPHSYQIVCSTNSLRKKMPEIF